MKIQEYQSKLLFSKFGIPIPRGQLASNSKIVRQIAEEIGSDVVIKAQVPTGGRGKAGGVRLARSPEEAESLANQILGMTIKNLPVHKVLVDEAIKIKQELYLGITINRLTSCPVMIASGQGGMDIEEIAINNPKKVAYANIHPLLGLREYQVRDLALSIDMPKQFWRMYQDIADGLWHTFQKNDATLVEINPLVISENDQMIALDGKLEIDDNALFRHPDLSELRDLEMEDSVEVEARKYGLAYIRMKGNIGCLVNGAGLAMATMDIIKRFGGAPANFLDIGGGAGAEKVSAAIRIILSDPKVKSVLINIYGGITRCDEVARGIIDAIEDIKTEKPFVIRLEGTNAKVAKQLLMDAKLISVSSFSKAVQKAVEMGGKKL